MSTSLVILHLFSLFCSADLRPQSFFIIPLWDLKAGEMLKPTTPSPTPSSPSLWSFPLSRSGNAAAAEVSEAEDTRDTSDWIMPPSRSQAATALAVADTEDSTLKETDTPSHNEQLVETFMKLPDDLKNNFSNVSLSLKNRLINASEELQQQFQFLQLKLASDVASAISGQDKNETKLQLETPGFFDSFTMVSSFLEQLTEALFQQSQSQEKYSKSPESDIPGARGSDRVQRNPRDVLLPGFGEFGDIVNDVATTILNTVTVWMHQYNGDDCVQRLVCESNRDIFGRGYFIPSLLTYMSNLFLSVTTMTTATTSHGGKPSDILLAARKGRKGEEDCLQAYPRCQVQLRRK